MSGHEAVPSTATEEQGRAAAVTGIALDVALPLAVFYGLRLAGADQLLALVAGGVVPVVRFALTVARERRVERLTLFSLSLIGCGSAIGWLTADPRLLLARESYLTAVLGLWILGTLLARRPLIFEATVRLMPEADAQAWRRDWDERPTFRRIIQVMTAAWGIAFLIDAAARVVMAYTLPVDTVPLLSSLLLVLMLATVVQAGRAYARRHLRN